MGAQSDTSIYFYNPSLPAACLFAVLYFFPLAVLIWQTCVKYRTWYLVVLPIGALFEVGGYIGRAWSVSHVTDIASYATSSSLIVIAPLFIAAANYMLLGRLVLSVLPIHSQRLLGFSPRWITRIFVTSDIISFLVQCSGSGVASSDNWQGKTGLYMLIGGLALQLITNVAFMLLVATFWSRSVRKGQVRRNAPHGWERVALGVVISIVLVFIRSVYRLAEFALGFKGYLFTHEWVFYVLEALPMLPAISIFCLWYPGRFLTKNKRACLEEDGMAGESK